MRILISAVSRFTSPTGICRYAASLASCVAAAKSVSEVVLVIGDWQRDYYEGCFGRSGSRLRLRTVAIRNASLTRNRWFLFGLPTLAKEEKADLVHLSFPIPFLRGRFNGPVVSTVHDMYPYEFPQNFGRVAAVLNRTFLKWCITRSDALCCVSLQTMQSLTRYLGHKVSHKPVAVTPNVVDLKGVEPVMPQWMPADCPGYLLSVAQHRSNKRLDVLLHAFSRLRAKNSLPSDAKLMIVGSRGPETRALEQLITSLALDQYVILVSGVTEPELSWLYRNAHAVIVASSMEGFCIPVVESLQCGARVVCSDLPVLRDIGGSHCTFFEEKNDLVESLVSAIKLALANDNTVASPTFLQRFASETVRSTYLDMYSAVLR
jgi:glycosyltransferase involved in cell wall biosynthesis